MEGTHLTANYGELSMRWDLLESQPPADSSLTTRLAAPSRCNDVFIAVNSALQRYVLVRIPDGEPCTITDRSSRGISLQVVEMRIDNDGNNEIFVEIACIESSGYAALDTVTLELVDAILAGASTGRVRLVQSVLAKWRRFWSGITQNTLSKEQHLGLFGELWFLFRWLIPAIGTDEAIAMWQGPVGARNDFEGVGWAVEVKTSGRTDGSHHIHGLEQLLDPPGVKLFLFSLLVREEASAIDSLSDLVSELRKVLSGNYTAISKFDAMLAAAGYDDQFTAEYQKIKFRIRGQSLYRVESGFPRLIPDSLAEELPPGISNLNYELRLDGAATWVIGNAPLDVFTLFKDLTISHA